MNAALTFLAFGACSFLNIFLRAGQQLNVFHDRRALVIPFSLGMQACEVFLVVSTVALGPGWIILFGGVGAGCGTLSAMYINKRWMKK